jgi:hypothetical protein
MRRKLPLLAALVAGAAVFVAVAVGASSHISPSPVELDTTTLYWSGQGSDANFKLCGDNADPGAGGFQNGANANNYMLWIFTTDGGAVQDPPGPTVTIDGTPYGNAFNSGGSDSGSWQIVTPFVAPGSISSAFATFAVDDPGDGSWILTISHGCGGGRTPAAGPGVSKDANGSYDNTFSWKVGKSADTDTVYSAGGGESGAVNYTVTVSHGDGAVSKVKVTGMITVNNPDSGAETLDSIKDELVDGSDAHVADCVVDTSGGLVVSTGSTNYPYSCDLGNSLPSGDLYNKVTIAWSDQNVGTTQHLDAGSASFTTPSAISFTPNDVDECVDVTDTLGGSLGKVCVGDDNPTTFKYPVTFKDDPGTCTKHDNTATATTEDTNTSTGSDKVTVQDCQGADLKVSKTANGTYDRECKWTIEKKANAPTSQTVDAGKPATFSYTVTLKATCTEIKNVKVTGKITVTNPNDWEDITLDSLTDALDSSGACTVDAGPYVVPKSGSITVGYTCNNATLSDTKNTAIAKWDAAKYHTPTGTASGSADVKFVETLIDDCVDVSDNYKGSLGHFCSDAAGNITGSNGATNPINYTLTFYGPAAGTCKDFTNTASFVDNSTPQQSGKASAKVTLCSFIAALTPGYWKNHAADSKSGSGHPYYSGDCSKLKSSSCSTNGPFAKQYLPQSLNGYSVSSILLADPIWAAMNCSSTKDQDAVGCLAAHLLAAKLNVANGANPCINPTIASADAFLTAIGYTGPGKTYTLSPAQRTQAINLKSALDKYNNGGGC